MEKEEEVMEVIEDEEKVNHEVLAKEIKRLKNQIPKDPDYSKDPEEAYRRKLRQGQKLLLHMNSLLVSKKELFSCLKSFIEETKKFQNREEMKGLLRELNDKRIFL